MKKFVFSLISVFVFILLFCNCEDQISLDLKNDAGRTVIIGDLYTSAKTHHIDIFKTTSVLDSTGRIPVTDAQVTVTVLSNNRVYNFVSQQKNGIYENSLLQLREGRSYQLDVKLADGTHYSAKSTVPALVRIDSVGIGVREIFNKKSYYVSVIFHDPSNIQNNYLYKLSVNSSPYEFARAQNDKYNNGLKVQHDIFDRNEKLKLGDKATLMRQCVDRAAFDFWNDFQKINPGSASPGNPRGNISGDGLGYFSTSSSETIEFEIKEGDLIKD